MNSRFTAYFEQCISISQMCLISFRHDLEKSTVLRFHFVVFCCQLEINSKFCEKKQMNDFELPKLLIHYSISKLASFVRLYMEISLA